MMNRELLPRSEQAGHDARGLREGATVVLLAALVILLGLSGVNATSMNARYGGGAAAATPAATGDGEERDPLDGDLGADRRDEDDPLDGDPLDGEPPQPQKDVEAPRAGERLEVARSGRPTDAPQSLPAYDGDPTTAWDPGDDETWLWFDLGEKRRLRAVRWLVDAPGEIEVAVSQDRRRWRDLGRQEVIAGWDGVAVRADARFVRLTLLANDDGELPQLAEVTVYGADSGEDVALAQKAKNKKDKNKNRNKNKKDNNDSRDENTENDNDRNRSRSRNRNRSGGATDSAGTQSEDGNISVEPGETNCTGKRARCRARKGQVSVEEDCQREGTCTIDIQADGGTATCDSSGPDDRRAGNGRGKRGGDGGRCEATANGGTVTIGDIDP